MWHNDSCYVAVLLSYHRFVPLIYDFIIIKKPQWFLWFKEKIGCDGLHMGFGKKFLGKQFFFVFFLPANETKTTIISQTEETPGNKRNKPTYSIQHFIHCGVMKWKVACSIKQTTFNTNVKRKEQKQKCIATTATATNELHMSPEG